MLNTCFYKYTIGKFILFRKSEIVSLKMTLYVFLFYLLVIKVIKNHSFTTNLLSFLVF